MVLAAHSLRWTEKGQYALESSLLSLCLDPYAHCSQGTLVKGQQPQLPVARRQQVYPSGQLTSVSHFTSFTVGGRHVIRGTGTKPQRTSGKAGVEGIHMQPPTPTPTSL